MSSVDVAVNVAFKARDGLSRALDRIADRAQSVRVRMQKFFAKLDKMAMRSRSIMGGVFGGMLLSSGIFALAMSVRRVADEFVGMDQAVTSAAAKFPELIQRGTREFALLETAVRNIGKSTEFTAKEAAQGLEFLAMAGFNAEQAMSVLPAVVDLATGANMDLARATDIATDALGAFNLQSKDTAQLTENLTRINDVFARTVTSSNVTLEHIYETMKNGGPVMTTAGQSVETFAALVGTMGNAGIKGSKAGTTLKNMALRLAAPVGQAESELKRLGITVADSSGNMRDMLDILDDLSAATAHMGTQQRSAAIDTIFGKRAVAGINVVLSTGVDKVRKFRAELEGAKGASAELASEMRKGIGVRLKVLQSSLIEMGFKFLETFQEKFPNALDDAITAVQNFDPAPMLDAIGKLIDIGKRAYAFFVEWKPAVIAVVGALAGLKVATMAATVALGIMNIVALLNPFLLLAAAIGVAVAMLWYYWDDVQQWAGGVVESVLGMTDDINLAFSKLVNAVHNSFVNMWNLILGTFSSGLNKIFGLAESVSAVIGLDLNFDNARRDLLGFMQAGKRDTRQDMTLRQVRNTRREAWGLPATTAAQDEVLQRSGHFDRGEEGGGRPDFAAMGKMLVDPNTLQSRMPDQTTDINLDISFKDLMSQFENMVTVDTTATSTSGTTNTTVNKKRAGAN